MMTRKKRIIIISSIVVVAFVIMGIVYAFFGDSVQKINKIKVGSVRIENLNLSLKKSNGETATIIEPADIDTLSWTTSNIGTSGVLTRHTLEIYWKEATDASANNLLAMYPANMSKEAILEDFAKSEPEYQIETENVSKTESGVTKYGIKYQFVGDTLNGTDGKEVSKEVNYNTSNEAILDANRATDDTSKTVDEIAYRLILSPQTSYLFQGKQLSIKVTTEAMQYTEDGSENWTVVDVQEIP
ncbi:MAG: hypothetical protein IJ890_09415 [Clostridia bacterium]|nr:hypothetical protein [Clostridia bacterium]